MLVELLLFFKGDRNTQERVAYNDYELKSLIRYKEPQKAGQ